MDFSNVVIIKNSHYSSQNDGSDDERNLNGFEYLDILRGRNSEDEIIVPEKISEVEKLIVKENHFDDLFFRDSICNNEATEEVIIPDVQNIVKQEQIENIKNTIENNLFKTDKLMNEEIEVIKSEVNFNDETVGINTTTIITKFENNTNEFTDAVEITGSNVTYYESDTDNKDLILLISDEEVEESKDNILGKQNKMKLCEEDKTADNFSAQEFKKIPDDIYITEEKWLPDENPEFYFNRDCVDEGDKEDCNYKIIDDYNISGCSDLRDRNAIVINDFNNRSGIDINKDSREEDVHNHLYVNNSQKSFDENNLDNTTPNNSTSENLVVGRRTSKRKAATKSKCRCCTNVDNNVKKLHNVNRNKKEKVLFVKEQNNIPFINVNMESIEDTSKTDPLNQQNNSQTTLDDVIHIKNKLPNNIKKIMVEVIVDKEKTMPYFSCPVCEQRFILKVDLMLHWRSNHAVKHVNIVFYLLSIVSNFKQCLDCAEIKNEISGTTKHLVSHFGINSTDIKDCFLCGMLYSKLNTHINLHFPYNCLLCHRKYSKKNNLNKHLSQHASKFNDLNNENNNCKLCGKPLSFGRDSILKHYLIHHSFLNVISSDDLIRDKIDFTLKGINDYIKSKKICSDNIMLKSSVRFVCSFCKSEYCDINIFIGHLISVHNADKNKCDSCEIVFKSYKELQSHIIINHNNEINNDKKIINHNNEINNHQRIIICPCCNVKFVDVISFSIHFRNHNESALKEKLQCPICYRELFNVFCLKRHMLIHSEEKPHKCSVCQRRFRDRRNLKSHIKTNHGSKRHMLIPSEEKPNTCSVCQQRFRNKRNLDSHMKNKHGSNPMTYFCGICNKKLKYKDSLLQHYKYVHSK